MLRGTACFLLPETNCLSFLVVGDGADLIVRDRFLVLLAAIRGNPTLISKVECRELGKAPVDTKHSRRNFLQTAGAAGAAAVVGQVGTSAERLNPDNGVRRFHCVQIDVFTSRRLEGNPLAVFLDARGLSDEEMQDLARETNLQETTFVFPRDAATEREQGVKVRIFVPNEEIPFAGHPTLGTAMVLRRFHLASQKPNSAQTSDTSEITLDLKVGKIPVHFRTEPSGSIFGEMRQVDPLFGAVHDRNTIAGLLDCRPKTFPATRRSRRFPLACSS